MKVAVDIETYDPRLKMWGSGAIRRDGCILGVGMYSPEGLCDYFDWSDPIVGTILEDPGVMKIFHNGVYDLDWLVNWAGYPVRGAIEDTMTREALLDMYSPSFSLDYCCEKRGIPGKNKGDTIDRYWAVVLGKSGKAVEHLREIPREVVGEYCIQDCIATYSLYEAQQPAIEKNDLQSLNDVEAAMNYIVIEMRKNGFPMNWQARDRLSDQLNQEYASGVAALEARYGLKTLSLNKASDLSKIFQAEHLPLQLTETGRPSFSSEVLDTITHPVAQEIRHLRSLDKLISTFIDGGFVNSYWEGKEYCTFYPAKRDAGGTVTGRWSSRDFNAQNIPAREEKHGTDIRSLFVPEEGCLLGAFDYKQIEYRVFTHFAVGEEGREAQQKFQENPDLDYHTMVQGMMGWLFEDKKKTKAFRHITKNLSFGSIYGLGAPSFAKKFAIPLKLAHPDVTDEDLPTLAKILQDEYYQKIPFVKPTMRAIQNVGASRGYVKTVAGRRQGLPPDGKLYKLINYLVQGTAADILKKALKDAYESGVFDVLKLHALVHDEVVFSIPQTAEGYQACLKLKERMLNPYKLKVPLGVDTEIGPDWGHCTMENWEEFEARFKA